MMKRGLNEITLVGSMFGTRRRRRRRRTSGDGSLIIYVLITSLETIQDNKNWRLGVKIGRYYDLSLFILYRQHN